MKLRVHEGVERLECFLVLEENITMAEQGRGANGVEGN